MTEKTEHLKDLLLRLEDRSLRPGLVLPKGVMSSSDLTIAHTAREEINSLNDEDYIESFKELLNKEKATINKINLITYLIRLADKFQRNDIADYVLGLVRKEKTRWVNDVSIGGLNRSNLIIENEREILFELANHKDWQIRFDSLGLLSKLPKPYHKRIEKLCFVQVEKYKSKHHSLGVLSSTLSKVGTIDSISILKEIVEMSKKSDTILSGINAINQIEGQSALEYFVECYLKKKDSFVKRELIIIIARYGNQEHSDLLLKRAKSLLSKQRKTNWHYGQGTEPELVSIIKFLDKHSMQKSTKLIQWIKQKKMDLLDKTETNWLDKRLKNGIEQ